MSVAELVISKIKAFEPKLTSVAAKERAGADLQSVRVASLLCLTLTAISVLNRSSVPSAAIREEIDRIVAALPNIAGENTVRLDQVLLDPELSRAASEKLLGANGTSAATAIRLAYSLCVAHDLQRMAAMQKGPLGAMGGPTAVSSERLIGKDRSEAFMEISFVLTQFVNDIGNSNASASGAKTPNQQATGCIFASVAILVGAGAGIAGLNYAIKSLLL